VQALSSLADLTDCAFFTYFICQDCLLWDYCGRTGSLQATFIIFGRPCSGTVSCTLFVGTVYSGLLWEDRLRYNFSQSLAAPLAVSTFILRFVRLSLWNFVRVQRGGRQSSRGWSPLFYLLSGLLSFNLRCCWHAPACSGCPSGALCLVIAACRVMLVSISPHLFVWLAAISCCPRTEGAFSMSCATCAPLSSWDCIRFAAQCLHLRCVMVACVRSVPPWEVGASSRHARCWLLLTGRRNAVLISFGRVSFFSPRCAPRWRLHLLSVKLMRYRAPACLGAMLPHVQIPAPRH
jgi:hypothetical protein